MVHSKGRSTGPCTANRQELTAGGKKGILPQQTLPCCSQCSRAVQVQRLSLSAKGSGDEGFSILALTQQERGSVRKQLFSPQNKQQARHFCHISKEKSQEVKNTLFSFICKLINISSHFLYKQMFKPVLKPKRQACWNIYLQKTAFWNHFSFCVTKTSVENQATKLSRNGPEAKPELVPHKAWPLCQVSLPAYHKPGKNHAFLSWLA